MSAISRRPADSGTGKFTNRLCQMFGSRLTWFVRFAADTDTLFWIFANGGGEGEGVARATVRDVSVVLRVLRARSCAPATVTDGVKHRRLIQQPPLNLPSRTTAVRETNGVFNP